MSQLTVQLPDAVLDAVRKIAARENVTIEEFVARMVAESVRFDEVWEQRVQRGRHVSRERYLEMLAKSPDVPPMPGDEIE